MSNVIQPGAIPLASLLRREDLGGPNAPSGTSIGNAIGGAIGGATPAAPSGPSFAERVGDALQNVQQLEARGDAAAEGLVRGEHEDVHGTMIAMQEADVALRLTTNIRNRAIEAYREVMRMGA